MKVSFLGDTCTLPGSMRFPGREQEMLTLANGKFQSINGLLRGTHWQHREEKPENDFHFNNDMNVPHW